MSLREMNKRHTRFYKTKDNLEKALVRWDLPQPRLIVETVDGWTAIFAASDFYAAGQPVMRGAHYGFNTL